MKKEKKPNYIQKISAKNKSPEEVERITNLFNDNINLAHNIAKKYFTVLENISILLNLFSTKG